MGQLLNQIPVILQIQFLSLIYDSCDPVQNSQMILSNCFGPNPWIDSDSEFPPSSPPHR